MKSTVPTDRGTGPSPNQESQKTAADQTLSSSAPEGREIEKTEPSYQNNPIPEYPRRARRRGYAGTVILKVLVSEKGTVLQIELAQSSGHGILDRAAMQSVEKWTFEPGAIGDRKVDMWVNIPVRFDLR